MFLLLKLNKAIKYLLIQTIFLIRPLLGPQGSCRFITTCSQFSIEKLQTLPLHKAIWAITKRILSCHPFSKKNRYEL